MANDKPRPPEAPSQFEAVLERIEQAVARIDKKKLLRWVRIVVKLAVIAFKFVPMSGDERALLNDIITGINEGIATIDSD